MENSSSIQLKIPQDIIGKRVEVNEHLATIKFAGPLVHEGKPEGSDKEIWFGVEWDDISRGKHNGTVKNHQYFQTEKDANIGGSLIKQSKGSLGINILDGIFKKYFKDDIGDELKVKICEKLLNNGENQEEQKQEGGEENKDGEENDKKNVLVEFDQDAFFETSRKQKKMVEFYGFDKIWEKINNMSQLLEISLYQVNISDLGPKGYFEKLLPNLRVLSLEKNLIFDWDQVFQIGYELKNLEELQIARNVIRYKEQIDEQKTIKCYHDGSEIQVSPVGIFKKLKYLNFIEMSLNWKQVCNLLPAFPNLEDLILCINDLTDTQNINLRENDLQKLSFMNLESANLSSFDGIAKFKDLPSLEKLILNKNKFKSLGKITGFKNVKLFSLEKNLVEDALICSEIAQFPSIEILNIKHNPMADLYGKSYIRQRAVAENPNIIFINGSDLKKYERKDCEIYYLRRTFDDYFKLKKSVYYDYDFEDFVNWCKDLHPRIDHLLQVYGNPYEQQPKNPDNLQGEVQPKNVMIKISIVIAAGPLLGKGPLNKKFPESTTVQTLKNVFGKLLQIPTDEQLVYYKVNQNDPMEILEEEHKTISHYGIKDGSEITVSCIEKNEN